VTASRLAVPGARPSGESRLKAAVGSTPHPPPPPLRNGWASTMARCQYVADMGSQRSGFSQLGHPERVQPQLKDEATFYA
jgi:hypothetical protein